MTQISLQEILQKSMSDEEFRTKLVKSPRKLLVENGIQVPEDLEFEVHENQSDIFHAVLPLPTEKTVMEELAKINPAFAKMYYKAWTDEDFKKRLLADPSAGFQEATGIHAPEFMKIVMHENTPNLVHIALPYVSPVEGELSDADLEAVAGGKGAPSKDNDIACSGGATASLGVTGTFTTAGITCAVLGGPAGWIGGAICGVIAVGGVIGAGVAAGVSVGT
ncbi:MAG: hypothetical protein CVV64_16765 [Candidatus Wallbacteria bacterium HGW-Wallbacteria-1]|jgi:hypothetical protein|uniref:Nitrile hydratase alpha/Thiocyanate hydrolase gamma domain-containing protein n=1 Tax=Candidatus Wallbacteria bacterium HGW-Wallbacteria-1 TaxID=2013854 RepID=A0A2N1PKP3_9BACT|nr:MAG: hypothetical protein CVV64_16765 [Candidatus Wallbacteria bacterium HGW-Wallbacteria-1]